MIIIALLWTVATATSDLANDRDPIFFHEWSELSYISISAVDALSVCFHLPTTAGEDELGTKAVSK